MSVSMLTIITKLEDTKGDSITSVLKATDSCQFLLKNLRSFEINLMRSTHCFFFLLSQFSVLLNWYTIDFFPGLYVSCLKGIGLVFLLLSSETHPSQFWTVLKDKLISDILFVTFLITDQLYHDHFYDKEEVFQVTLQFLQKKRLCQQIWAQNKMF